MPDKRRYRLHGDNEARLSQHGALPVELLPLDALLRRDGMLWRDGMPSDRRLAQLAKRLAAHGSPTAAPLSDHAEGDPARALKPDNLSYLPAASRASGRAVRWRLRGNAQRDRKSPRPR